jgi:hypothetical protein
MQLGVPAPFHATDGDPGAVRDYAQCLEATGYGFLEAPTRVLGANIAAQRDWDPDRNSSQDRFQSPFVPLGRVFGVAPRLRLSKSTRAAREAGAASVRW